MGSSIFGRILCMLFRMVGLRGFYFKFFGKGLGFWGRVCYLL